MPCRRQLLLLANCKRQGRQETTHLVEVDVHALKLELGSAVVDTIGVETMLARDGLPVEGSATRSIFTRTGHHRCRDVNIPESSTDLVALKDEKKYRSAHRIYPIGRHTARVDPNTYALAGLEVNLYKKTNVSIADSIIVKTTSTPVSRAVEPLCWWH